MTVELDISDWLLEADEVRRVASALYHLVQPVELLLDRFDEHLTPRMAAPNVVTWLTSWFGIDFDADPGPRLRAVLAAMPDIHDAWGTSRGLRTLISTYLGIDPTAVKIQENGGASWSTIPGGEPPGSTEPFVAIRVHVPDPATVDHIRLDRLVASACPRTCRTTSKWAPRAPVTQRRPDPVVPHTPRGRRHHVAASLPGRCVRRCRAEGVLGEPPPRP